MYRKRDDAGIRRNTVVSLVVMFVLIAVVVPWQVAFLGCWIIHLFTCATSAAPLPSTLSSPTPRSISPPRPSFPPSPQCASPSAQRRDSHNHAAHALLLMTWLLPLVAPVLVVWVRALASAGYAAPFAAGDRGFFAVAPFLVLVDYASWARGPVLVRTP